LNQSSKSNSAFELKFKSIPEFIFAPWAESSSFPLFLLHFRSGPRLLSFPLPCSPPDLSPARLARPAAARRLPRKRALARAFGPNRRAPRPSAAPAAGSLGPNRASRPSVRAFSLAATPGPPVSVVFNHRAVSPLGRAARPRLLRVAKPRTTPPNRPRVPRAHAPPPITPPAPPLGSTHPETEPQLLAAIADASELRRPVAPRSAEGIGRHPDVRRSHRSPFDASPSRPDRCTAASATTTPSRLVRRRQAFFAPSCRPRVLR